MQSRFVLLLVLLLLSLIPHSSAAALPSSIRASTRRHLDEDKKDDNDEDEMGDPVITRECEMSKFSRLTSRGNTITDAIHEAIARSLRHFYSIITLALNTLSSWFDTTQTLTRPR